MFKGNIEVLTIRNNNYRKVLSTTRTQQLVLMALKQGEDIPKEKHNGTQFIRVESGTGVAYVGRHRYNLSDGTALVIPPNATHYIKATDGLKLYTIYSPPEHSAGLVQRRQSKALPSRSRKSRSRKSRSRKLRSKRRRKSKNKSRSRRR